LIHQKTDGQRGLPRRGGQIVGRAGRGGGAEKALQPWPVDQPMLFARRLAKLSQKLIEFDQRFGRLPTVVTAIRGGAERAGQSRGSFLGGRGQLFQPRADRNEDGQPQADGSLDLVADQRESRGGQQ